MLDIYGNIQLENYTAVASVVGKGAAELGTKTLEKALDAAKKVGASGGSGAGKSHTAAANRLGRDNNRSENDGN
jgi:hypothetical protein